jgi:hypothetical protein
MTRKNEIGSCLIVLALLTAACGYKVQSSAGHLPAGVASLGIPTFLNYTSEFKAEQQMTSAGLKEFSIRTGIPVNSEKTGVDAVLLGEIRAIKSIPVTFGSDPVPQNGNTNTQATFGSVFIVTVQMGVKLVRLKDSKVIWENKEFVFRERYQINTNAKDFFAEQGPALDRLAREFAASLVSAVLNK